MNTTERTARGLRKAYSSGVLTKASINRRGYNKFLTISKDVQVVINEQEIENDAKWDGLKGYVTNTDLDAEQVVAQYHSLWYVERAFRITKGNLEARPIFHFHLHLLHSIQGLQRTAAHHRPARGNQP